MNDLRANLSSTKINASAGKWVAQRNASLFASPSRVFTYGGEGDDLARFCAVRPILLNLMIAPVFHLFWAILLHVHREPRVLCTINL